MFARLQNLGGDRQWRRWTSLALCLILLICGLALWLGLDDGRVKLQNFVLQLGNEQQLVGRLYLPTRINPPYPAVLLCHGVSSTKATMSTLATELARRDIAAITMDFGGDGESYKRPPSQEGNQADAKAILQMLQHRSDIDQARLGIAGHSMGGTTALEVATDNPQLRTTVLLGIAGTATPSLPQNLLFASGLYEELNPVHEMRGFFKETTGKTLREGEFTGSFANGTARLLFISSTSDHFLTPYDPNIVQIAVNWARQSFNLPPNSQPVIFHWRVVGMVLSFMGAIGLGLQTYAQLAQYFHSRLLTGIIGGLTIITHLTHLNWGEWTSNCLMGLLLITTLGNYIAKAPNYFIPIVKYALLYGLLIISAFTVTVFVSNFTAVIENSSALSGLLQFWSYVSFGLLYDRFHTVRAVLFPVYSTNWYGFGLWLGVFGIEITKPSTLLTWAQQALVWLVVFIRQPVNLKWHSPSQRSLIILAGSLVGLIIVLYQQWQAGLLKMEVVTFTLRLMVIYMLLPLVLCILALRSPLYSQLENRWLKP